MSYREHMDPVLYPDLVRVPGAPPTPIGKAHMVWERLYAVEKLAVCTVCGATVPDDRERLVRHATWHDVHDDVNTHDRMDAIRATATEDPA